MLRTLAALSVISFATPAWAEPSMCPTDEHRSILRAFSQKLAAADDVDEAKGMAMKKLRAGEKVFDLVENLAPDAEGMVEARAKFDAFEATVLAASSTQEVASAFDDLAAPDQQAVACDLDTVELIIVIIGFVLFIIPGIILLLLLC
jgi:hypothetical protein